MATTTASTPRLGAIAVGAGAVLGAASLLIVRFLPHPINLLGTLGGPWMATAFGVGSCSRRRSWAALAGAASLAAGVTAYYFLRKVVRPGAFGGFTVGGEAINYLLLGS